MGLIKAAFGAAGGVLADQWKEYFYCDSLPENVLMAKGEKRTGKRSSNTKGSDNVISNGSVIAVADGQAMIIVDSGRIAEFCAEPGEFTYDTSAEPSIFSGSLGESIKAYITIRIQKRNLPFCCVTGDPVSAAGTSGGTAANALSNRGTDGMCAVRLCRG